MAIETQNNFSPKVAKHLDERLKSVPSVADLPNPNNANNFLYLGALAFVVNENCHYRCEADGTDKIWRKFDTDSLLQGVINIAPTDTNLDLDQLPLDVTKYDTIRINIVGGTFANLNTISNFPENQLLTFIVSVGKQVRFKHFDYDVATTNQIVLENGFDMTLSGRSIGDEALTLKKQGVALCQWDAVQFVKSSEWLMNLLSVTVLDNLESESTTASLSANQGRVLEAKKQNKLVAGSRIILTELPTAQPFPTTRVSVEDPTWERITYEDFPGFVGFIPSSVISDVVNLYSQSASNKYKYFDFRKPSAGYNYGVYVLPPGQTGFNNAILVQQGVPTAHQAYQPSSMNLSSLANDATHRISFLSAIGSNNDLTCVSVTDSKYFRFVRNGLYKISAVFNIARTTVEASDNGPGANLGLNLFRGSGVLTDSTPLAGLGAATLAFSSYNAIPAELWGTTKITSISLSYTLEVTQAQDNLNNSFFLVLSKIAPDTWGSLSLLSTSQLQIDKIS
jgi:hypothetical protein